MTQDDHKSVQQQIQELRDDMKRGDALVTDAVVRATELIREGRSDDAVAVLKTVIRE